MLTATPLEALSRVGKALADPTRCRLLLTLLDGPAYPAELADRLTLSRANCSNHLACLRGCGLVVATPQGRQVEYSLADPALARALIDLVAVVLAVDPGSLCRPAQRGIAVAQAASPGSAGDAGRVLTAQA